MLKRSGRIISLFLFWMGDGAARHRSAQWRRGTEPCRVIMTNHNQLSLGFPESLCASIKWLYSLSSSISTLFGMPHWRLPTNWIHLYVCIAGEIFPQFECCCVWCCCLNWGQFSGHCNNVTVWVRKKWLYINLATGSAYLLLLLLAFLRAILR